MWEYLIGYAGQQSDDPCAAEERDWPSRGAMEAELAAEGWEIVEDAPHRDGARRIIFRRAIAESASPPRHLIPCW